MAYQVMLGVPSAELEASLSAGFEELTDSQLVSVHQSSRDILDTVPKISNLDVVLIHEQLGPLPVLDLIRELSRNHPQLAVILLVDEVQADTFNQAMEAGARGVLGTNATLEELSSRISTAAEWSRTLRRHLEAASLDVPISGSRGSIVALSGSKGGVGTTTTAIQMALTAAKAGRVVCLVDLDLQTGDVPSYLDLNHRRSIVDLVEAADDISAAMLSDTLFVHPDGIHVLLAPNEGERGEDVTGRAARQILGALRSRYEVVIVDCGASMTEAGAMAVELADTSLVVVSPDLPAIRGGQRLVAMWDRLQIRKKDDVTSLLTRQSRKNEIQPDFVRKLLGTPMLKATLPASFRSLEEATNTGDPLRVTDEAFRKSLRQVSEEAGILQSQEPERDQFRDEEMKPASRSGKSGRKLLGGKKKEEGDDSGVALVELAALVPLFIFFALLVWQVVLVGLTSMYASHAAAEGARQAAVTPDNTEKVAYEARKRIAEPWSKSERFSLDISHPKDRDDNDGSFVQVSIATPSVLPGFDTSWEIGAETRIVPEGHR